MNIKKIKLSEVFLADNPKCEYKVLTGSILLFAVPLKNGKPQRRTFIAQMEAGSVFPAFHEKDDELGEWCFLCTAMEEAEVQCSELSSDKTILDFCDYIGLKIFDVESFSMSIVEKVNMRFVTEEGHIFAVAREQGATYRQSLKIIFNNFISKKKQLVVDESGNALYDTIAHLFTKEKISIIPFDSLKEVCGRKFDIADIARLSHCIYREVVLADGWHKRQSGNLLVFTEDSNKPMIALQKNSKSYLLVDVVSGNYEKITDEKAQTLVVKAYMFYRPFDNKELKPTSVIRFMLSSIKTGDAVNVVLLTLFSAIIGLLIPTLNEKIFDSYVPMGDQSGLIQISLLILSFMVGSFSFMIIKNVATFRMSNSMGIALQSAIFERMYNLPVSVYNKYDSTDLALRATSITQVFEMVSQLLVSSVITAVFSILYLFKMNGYSDELTKVSLMLILLNIVVVGIIGVVQIKYERQIAEIKAKCSSVSYQLIGAVAKIRISGVENRALLQYMEPYIDARKLTLKSQTLTNLAENMNLLMNTVFSAVFYYVVISKTVGLTVGEFTGFTSSFAMFSGAIVGLSTAFLQINNAVPTYDRARVYFETKPEQEENDVLLSKVTGKIDVNNLSFRYSPESEMVLKDVSVSIKPGEYVAIVGASGSGKSTLLRLFLGFETATVGKIYYDNQDIDRLNKRELRKKMGVVLQDGKLISASIFENITITSGTVKPKEVMEVIEKVGMTDEINEMAMGMHTVLTEGGGNISGGQKQRLLIARAIVNSPKLLFIDEATSALDNVNQALINESLSKLKATRVVIAHRLSTIINCDRILVLDKGCLVEEGNFQELMAMEGLFYQLAKRQIE